MLRPTLAQPALELRDLDRALIADLLSQMLMQEHLPLHRIYIGIAGTMARLQDA